MLKVHSSRRAAGMRPTDYDHEISLIDHDGYDGAARSGTETPPEADMERINTESQLLPNAQRPGRQATPPHEDEGDDTRPQERRPQENGEGPSHDASRPSIEIQSIYHLQPDKPVWIP